ncbi:MAG: hypothetical protein CME71_00685 [Halobacteriovorax sp.]|mgnify:FL=1|nr:hypothetical protein [Halobacteriovorax sp.]
MKNELEQNLIHYLEQSIPAHQFAEIYRYAVIPAGKLFRPKLALAAFEDAGGDIHNIPLAHAIWPFASALEIHHAYTLVHDDLPAMDDDDMRRGRPSTHKEFGQWQAILAGDGLAVASFRLLSRVNHPQNRLITSVAAHALGPKGLIQGQALDLSGEMKNDFHTLLLTHELKTARLIQLALFGGTVLASKNVNAKACKQAWRLGHAIGLSFQLLDDLGELTDEQLSKHEADVNPWLAKQSSQCCEMTVKLLTNIDSLAGKSVRHELSLYYKKTLAHLEGGKGHIESHLKDKGLLSPVMALLHSLRQ